MLGFMWTMLNPIIMKAVYTVVSSTIFRFPYNGTLPSLGIILMSVLLAVVTLTIGYTVFTRAEDDFVYYV
jgi:ABC-type polysaccharide/polyol phosphate export permease